MPSNDVTWPDNVLAISDAKRWISSVLTGNPEVIGPTAIYASKENFGVTARFSVASSDDVVLKANVYSGFSGAPHAFDLLSKHCPGHVPNVIAWDADSKSSRILMRPFEGSSLSAIRSMESLQETARTLARIQTKVAQLPESDLTGLSRVTSSSLLKMFDALLEDIESNQSTIWAIDNPKLEKILRFPGREFATRLKEPRLPFRYWVDEIAQQQWPVTICHGDMHADNVVLQKDGQILIYDWEDAFLGCPFLSLERLLVQAWNWDTGSQKSGPWGYVEATAGQIAVTDAYLETLRFKSFDERRRACSLAMCVAVVREAYSEWQWALSIGWEDGNPEWTAQLMNRLFQHFRFIR